MKVHRPRFSDSDIETMYSLVQGALIREQNLLRWSRVRRWDIGVAVAAYKMNRLEKLELKLKRNRSYNQSEAQSYQELVNEGRRIVGEELTTSRALRAGQAALLPAGSSKSLLQQRPIALNCRRQGRRLPGQDSPPL